MKEPFLVGRLIRQLNTEICFKRQFQKRFTYFRRPNNKIIVWYEYKQVRSSVRMDMLCVVVLSFCVLACARAEFLPSQSPDGRVAYSVPSLLFWRRGSRIDA
jgi:hypothetical protein